jgi:hypothetical protein
VIWGLEKLVNKGQMQTECEEGADYAQSLRHNERRAYEARD